MSSHTKVAIRQFTNLPSGCSNTPGNASLRKVTCLPKQKVLRIALRNVKTDN